MNESESREVGWLIESGAPWSKNQPLWLRIWVTGGMPSITWTEHAEAALRFCRKEDAEMFWYLHPEPANIPKITEHVFIGGKRAAQPPDSALVANLKAMCGWAELIAEAHGWTRDNAASFWASRDAARKLAPEDPRPARPPYSGATKPEGRVDG